MVIFDFFLNVGIMIVFQLEWLKNINYVSYGYLSFKYERDFNYYFFMFIYRSLERKFGNYYGIIFVVIIVGF